MATSIGNSNSAITALSATLATSISNYLPLAGGTVTGNVSFGDNDKAIFGAGSDLQIYHDGSQSIIEDVGTGQLKILAENTLYLGSATGTEAYIRALKIVALNFITIMLKKSPPPPQALMSLAMLHSMIMAKPSSVLALT